MYDISITDFGGVKQAKFKMMHRQLVLIVGKNYQGKSSILRACQALLTGARMPTGLAMTRAGHYIRNGAKVSTASIYSDAGTRRIIWYEKEATIEGEGPNIGKCAAGLLSLSRMDKEKRSLELIALIGASPDEDELYAEVEKKTTWKRDDARYKLLEDLAFKSGFDHALKEVNAEGRSLKSQWQQITGIGYGNKQTGRWTPSGWEGKDPRDMAAVEKLINEAQQSLEKAIASEAVTTDRIQAFKAIAERLKEYESNEKWLNDAIKKDESLIELSEKTVLDIRNAGVGTGVCKACPECGKDIIIEGINLVKKADAKPPQDVDALMRANELLTKQRQALAELRSDLTNNQRQINESTAAAAKVKEMTKEAAKRKENLPKSEEIRAQLNELRLELSAADKIQRAKGLQLRIEDNLAIQDILAPEGLRQNKLVEKMDSFNERLRDLCTIAGWVPVHVEADTTIMIGHREYSNGPSESEQFRTDVILQLAIAQINKQNILLIDRADVLDAQGRAGLFNLLVKTGMAAIVGMTANKTTDVPNLAAMKCGQTLWIENGMLEPAFVEAKV